MAVKFLKENGFPVDLVIESQQQGISSDSTFEHQIFVNDKYIETFWGQFGERRSYAMGFLKAWELRGKILEGGE